MSVAKRMGKQVFKSLGLDVKRISPPPVERPIKTPRPQPRTKITLEAGLERAGNRSLNCATVIDVGASDGRWSAKCIKYFPDAFYFLVEGNPVHEPGLQKFKKEHPQSDFVLAAGGDQAGAIHFSVADAFGGSASYSEHKTNSIVVPMTTIDNQVKEKKLQGPFLVKLDTHGFERQILQGAAETLQNTSLLIVEAYNFVKSADQMRFHELCAYMESKNFRCIDLVEPFFRPHDNALWQMDLFFIRSDHPSFSSNSFSMK